MATTPYFLLSPNTALSVLGLIRGPDKTVPTPVEDWRYAKVDVVIPALNEASNIPLCIESLSHQTFRPNRVILIDDGSTDQTLEYAQEIAKLCGLELTVIHRQRSIGKTPTLKRQSRESDADVEFILDADTILDSPDYIARTVEELYKAVGIASACGTVLSTRMRDRRSALERPALKQFLKGRPEVNLVPVQNAFQRMQRGGASIYRECLYLFLQRFVYVGQMKFFGSISHPIGCAVAYRRKYIQDLFAQYEPILGDDLTNSEDIFIGFALINHGYRNIQLRDVLCRSQEPPLRLLPRQFYMWSSSFLQSCFFFNSLVASPFKALSRWRHSWREKHTKEGQATIEKRKIMEPYREPFGDHFTNQYGRPIGWSIFLSMIEKIAFPIILLAMLVMGKWMFLLLTILLESVFAVAILTLVAPWGHKWEFLGKGIMITPIRYSALVYDFTTTVRFATDLWIRKDKRWRK